MHPLVRLSRRNILATKVREEARCGARKGSRAAKPVNLARAAQVRRAGGVGRCRGRGKVLSRGTRVKHRWHVLEDAALDEHVSARSNLKRVAV